MAATIASVVSLIISLSTGTSFLITSDRLAAAIPKHKPSEVVFSIKFSIEFFHVFNVSLQKPRFARPVSSYYLEFRKSIHQIRILKDVPYSRTSSWCGTQVFSQTHCRVIDYMYDKQGQHRCVNCQLLDHQNL